MLACCHGKGRIVRELIEKHSMNQHCLSEVTLLCLCVQLKNVHMVCVCVCMYVCWLQMHTVASLQLESLCTSSNGVWSTQ